MLEKHSAARFPTSTGSLSEATCIEGTMYLKGLVEIYHSMLVVPGKLSVPGLTEGSEHHGWLPLCPVTDEVLTYRFDTQGKTRIVA